MSTNTTKPEELAVELVEKSCMSHLFRHASEITRETKGGYLEGRIVIPNNITFPVYLRLSLIPSDAKCGDENPFLLHPNLLHINMKLNKKNRTLTDGELPEDVDWVVMLKIEPDGSVNRVCGAANQISEKRFHHSKESSPQACTPAALNGEQQLMELYRGLINSNEPVRIGPLSLPVGKEVLKPVTKLEVGPNGERYLDMGNRGLMLNVITPLQKFSKGGATISDVLKQRYQDIFQREMSTGLLAKTEEVFTKKKEDRVKLQLVRLLVEVFSTDSTLNFLRSAVSDTITNSKSKECGPLQLYDVNPNTSCTEGSTKIFLLSFFKLVSDVRPVFIIYDPKGKKIVQDREDLRLQLNHPDIKDCNVFNQCVLIFTAPPQKPEVIKEIKRLGYELHITAYRPSDGRMSNTSFKFHYRRHTDPNDPIDSDSDDDPDNLDQNPDDPDEQTKQGLNGGMDQKSSSEALNLSGMTKVVEGMKKVRGRKCQTCSLLSLTFNHEEKKSLPLAKPGVHRRKNDILKYEQKQSPKGYRPSEKDDPMTFAEVGGEGGKIVEFKVDPQDLVESGFSAKRTKFDDGSETVQIKLEVQDEDEIQEVRLQPKSTEGHLTMPYPPPLASIATGQIVTSTANFMPMLIPNNTNTPRIVIMPNNLQQQQHQAINVAQDLSRTSTIVQHPIVNGDKSSAAGFRPNYIMTPVSSLNGTQTSTTLSSDITGTRLVRTSSGLLELKNFRMTPGQRIILAPKPGSQLPAQKSFSDPMGLTNTQRTFNGVTVASGMKRTLGSSIRMANTSNGITLPSSSNGVASTSKSNTFVFSTINGGYTHSGELINTTSPITLSSGQMIGPEIVKKVTSQQQQPIQISASLLKTLQTINQTKLVSGEREKLLPVTKRVQLQK